MILNRTKPCVFGRRSSGQAAFLQALPCLYRFFPLSKLPSAGLPGLYLCNDGCHGYLPSITPKGSHGFVFDLSIFGSFFGTSNILGRWVQTSVFLRQAMPVSGFKSVGWLMIMHKGCTTYILLPNLLKSILSIIEPSDKSSKLKTLTIIGFFNPLILCAQTNISSPVPILFFPPAFHHLSVSQTPVSNTLATSSDTLHLLNFISVLTTHCHYTYYIYLYLPFAEVPPEPSVPNSGRNCPAAPRLPLAPSKATSSAGHLLHQFYTATTIETMVHYHSIRSPFFQFLKTEDNGN